MGILLLNPVRWYHRAREAASLLVASLLSMACLAAQDVVLPGEQLCGLRVPPDI
jgi:hypothetical protein